MKNGTLVAIPLTVFILGMVSCDPDGTITRTGTPCEETTWLSSDDYQVVFDQEAARGCYPAEVYGRQKASSLQYRGMFEPIYGSPDDFDFQSIHGRTRAFYVQLDEGLRSQGFKRVWLQRFKASGVERYQATWTLVVNP